MTRPKSNILSNVAFVVALNAPFLLCHPGWPLLDLPWARSLAIGLVLFLTPGAAWTGLFAGRGWFRGFPWLAVMVIAWITLLVVLAVLHAAGRPLSAGAAWNGVWMLTNVGLALSLVFGRAALTDVIARDRFAWLVGGVFLAAYGLFFFSATRVVPPQEDNDFDMLGCGYGLLTRSEPLLVSDHETLYQFSHPPLAYFCTAASFLYFDRLDYLAYYDAASRRARAARQGKPIEPFDGTVGGLTEGVGDHRVIGVRGPNYLVDPPLRDGSRLIPVWLLENAVLGQYFGRDPELLPARTANIFVAALSVALLAGWIGRMMRGSVDRAKGARGFASAEVCLKLRTFGTIDPSRALAEPVAHCDSPRALAEPVAPCTSGAEPVTHCRSGLALALLVPLVYATSPEIFVRSGYGGHFATTNFAALMILMAVGNREAHAGDRQAGLACFLAGLVAAVTNHKLILLPLAVVLWELLRIADSWIRRRSRLAACAKGTVPVASNENVDSSPPVSRPVLAALLHPVVLGFACGTLLFWAWGLWVDPTDFWRDHLKTHFVDRILHNASVYQGDNYPSVVALWRELCEHTGYVFLPLALLAIGVEGVRRWRESPGLWLVWTLLASAAFSLVDWRQTKHLMPILLPLSLAVVVWTSESRIRLVLVATIFAGLALWNVHAIAGLAADFASFKITPDW